MIAELIVAAAVTTPARFEQVIPYMIPDPPGGVILDFEPWPPIGTVVAAEIEYLAEVRADVFLWNMTNDPVPFVLSHDGAVAVNADVVPRAFEYFEGVLPGDQGEAFHLAAASGVNRVSFLFGTDAAEFATQPDLVIVESGGFVGLPDESVFTFRENEQADGIGRIVFDVEFQFADLLDLLGAWNDCARGFGTDCSWFDFDGDDVVGTADLLVLLGAWAQSVGLEP